AAARETAAGEPGVLLAERRARVAPVVEAIRTWVAQQRALPQSALGKALAYTTELWPGLVAFLDDAAIPVDNNATERALRGIALGRKNHYGSRSERGTRVAALCYTLLESAKLAEVEPAAYLAEATRRAIPTPGQNLGRERNSSRPAGAPRSSSGCPGTGTPPRSLYRMRIQSCERRQRQHASYGRRLVKVTGSAALQQVRKPSSGATVPVPPL